MRFSTKMRVLAPGVFAKLAARKAELIAQGCDVIDLSVGTPDLPPDPRIMQVLSEKSRDPAQYFYALEDLPELRLAAADWYRRRFDVALDPDTEVTSLLGSQEGLAHIALTLCDEGSAVLVPDPCYPIFSFGPSLAGARVVGIPMRSENGFVIDFRNIAVQDAKDARLMIVSYPNNPTGAVAPPSWYRDLVAFARDYDIAVVHDNAYCELYFGEQPCGSFLAVEGARDVGVEFNSLSKTYAMAGARVGFCLGNRDIVGAMKRLKSNIDYGIFLPIQRAAIEAITGDQSCVARNRDAYRRRRDLFVSRANGMGWSMPYPQGAMFVWARIPEGWPDAETFCEAMMERAHVIMVPGESFGSGGAGYVRAALVQGEESIAEAMNRMEKEIRP